MPLLLLSKWRFLCYLHLVKCLSSKMTFEFTHSRPLVLDTVSVSDTFKMYLYQHIDTFFMENVSVYQYILCCRYFFWYYLTPFWPKYSRKFKFLSNQKWKFSIIDNISHFKNLLTLFLNIMIVTFEFLQKLSHKNAIKTEIRPKKWLKKYRYQILLKCIDTVLYRYIDTFDRK